MTYDQALDVLRDRGFGPNVAAYILGSAARYGRCYYDDTGVYALNDAGTRFSVRTVTIVGF